MSVVLRRALRRLVVFATVTAAGMLALLAICALLANGAAS